MLLSVVSMTSCNTSTHMLTRPPNRLVTQPSVIGRREAIAKPESFLFFTCDISSSCIKGCTYVVYIHTLLYLKGETIHTLSDQTSMRWPKTSAGWKKEEEEENHCESSNFFTHCLLRASCHLFEEREEELWILNENSCNEREIGRHNWRMRL